MRTFVAIELQPEIKEELARLVQRFAPLILNVRWVRKEGMHLTLKFLGEISESQAERVALVLPPLCHKLPSFGLAVRGTGWFPAGSRSPRVLWAGVESGPELPSLQKAIEETMDREGFGREDRAFHPHLTLGRVKSSQELRPILEEWERLKDAEFGRMTVSRVTFFQSRLRPEGAEYSILREFPLS